ncbi:hypothetical protein QZH41_020099, partial [Actinostola sp. cb2023]
AKEQVEERVAALQSDSSDTAAADAAPQKSQPIHVSNGVDYSTLNTVSQGGMWEDVNELLVLERGVKMFFVSELGNVTTLSEAQTLRVYQFIKYEEGCPHPPAFLQCSGWVFPMIPKRSPVLNTEPHTYMFPDITINPNAPPSAPKRPQKAFASVGLILNPHITAAEQKRFERILQCYTDFNHYTPTAKEYKELAANGQCIGATEVTSLHVREDQSFPNEAASSNGTLYIRPASGDVAIKDDDEVYFYETLNNTILSNVLLLQVQLSWGDKVSMGIGVAAEMIAWGLVKGAEAGSQVVYQGGIKIRSSLKPNETPTEVDEKVQQNIRHVKSVAGVACQVSSTVVSAVAAMTKELAKAIAPVVVEKGGKMLPQAVKNKTDDESGQKAVKEVVKVAASGVYGFAAIYEGLERSWKLLYKSLQLATVQTVDHKYGPQAGEATNNSLGALGFALQ